MPPAHTGCLIGSLDVVGELGYIGIFLLTFLENVFPPIPSELIMPLAGFHTANGKLSLWGAILAGFMGSLLGTAGWYWVGRRVGERTLRAFVERYGCWIGIEIEHLDRSKQWFQRRGAMSVFVGRLIPGVRTLISVPAGFSDMPLWEFLLPSAAGTLLWTAGLRMRGTCSAITRSGQGLCRNRILGVPCHRCPAVCSPANTALPPARPS